MERWRTGYGQGSQQLVRELYFSGGSGDRFEIIFRGMRFQINKGINKPIEFKGLKAQYIGYLGGGLVVLLVLFAILYLIGMAVYLCIMIIAASGSYCSTKYSA